MTATALAARRAALALFLAASLLSLPVACASRKAAAGATHRGVGTVVAVNLEKNRIKIDHEKMEGYMDAMTMWFDVKDAAMLGGLAPNDRVEFTVTEEEAADVITEIRKIS